jgi:hypothetical protein
MTERAPAGQATGERPSRQVTIGSASEKPVAEVARTAPPAKATFSDSRGLIGDSTTVARAAVPSFKDAREPLMPGPAMPPPSVSTQPTPPTSSTTVVAAAQPAAPRSVAVPPASAPPVACESPQIGSEPLDGGRMLVRIGSPCRAEQTVSLRYGEATLVGRLDGAGRLETTLDLFAGASSPVEITFADGVSREIPARANDLDKVEKIALIWRTPVNLDLHAFEYGAAFGQSGHVWAQAPSSAISARDQTAASKRGRGFLSRTDSGQGPGDKVEIYTFYRHPEQEAGAVSIAVDYAARGDLPTGLACGTGERAEIRFETVHTVRGRVSRESGLLAAAPCGQPLGAGVRFGAVHQIRINR